MERQPSTTAPRINRTTLTLQLEEALRLDILDGTLAPGQRLRAQELTERYGVSATPLREALQRLAAENLVVLDPRLGASVTPISEDDLRDIYAVLQLVDGLALERSIARGDQGWMHAIDTAFHRLAEAIQALEGPVSGSASARRRRAMELAEAHWNFHHALYQACGSPWLLRFVKQLHSHAERYRMLASTATFPPRDSRHEHEQIYQWAKAGDASRAVDALRKHLSLTVQVLVANMAQYGATPISLGDATPLANPDEGEETVTRTGSVDGGPGRPADERS